MARKTKNTNETEKIDIIPDVIEPDVAETPQVQNETAPQNPVAPKTAAPVQNPPCLRRSASVSGPVRKRNCRWRCYAPTH